MQANAVHDADEIGVRNPEHTPVKALGPGETGYLIAGIKDVREARSGETVTDAHRPASAPLEGYREPKPMVFCGLYPIDGDQFSDLRDALERLRLNDGSYTYEPETSGALGFGFRCGFLGLLHMEIIRERLVREFNLDLIATAPSVAYLVHRTDGEVIEVANPSALPEMVSIEFIEEPMLTCTILTPKDYTGTIMELCQNRRGEMTKLEYLSPERVELIYKMPLAEVVRDFFDQLKSRTQGYASLDYEPAGYRARRPREGRRAPQRRARRRLLQHPPRGQGAGLRPAHVREAQGADPPADVRRAHPGRHRRPDHQPRDREGQAQGRAGQVLRR